MLPTPCRGRDGISIRMSRMSVHRSHLLTIPSTWPSAAISAIVEITTAGWSEFPCTSRASWSASKRARGAAESGHRADRVLSEMSCFFATGNTFGGATWSDGEAVFRVRADLRRSENKRDYFAPSDWKTLDARDADLGGTNPLPLDFPGAGGAQTLMLALGKNRKANLLDRNGLGGIGGQLAAETVSELQIITSPVTYPVGDDIFVAFQAPGAHCPQPVGRYQLTVLKIAAAAPPTITTAWCGALRGGGSAIVTTTDGHSNQIGWVLGQSTARVPRRYRRADICQRALKRLRHLQTLIAAQDRLYVGADGHLCV
jgi:hypothetical protein